MKSLLRAVLLLLVLVVVGVGLGVWFLQQHGISARAEPTSLETAVALRLRHLSIPADQRDRKNPLQPTADNLKEGMEHFADHCAVCHANTGAGDTDFGRGLYPHPPILREARTQSLSDGELYAIIDNGIRFTGMPAFGGEGDHTAEDTWRLVLFIRHLPQQTKQEVTAMEKLNPKAPDDEVPKAGEPPAPAHTHSPGKG
jgi:mono/diheme cytochrome c family protein